MEIFTIYVWLRDFGKARYVDSGGDLIFYEGRKTSSNSEKLNSVLKSTMHVIGGLAGMVLGF
ncbi:hypothetical protein ACFL9U_11180 [Thermodesulfobacteriota bacterium]